MFASIGTSAAGPLAPVRVRALVGVLLSAPIATTTHPLRECSDQEATHAGETLERPENAIAEIRRLTGFTWEQLASLCRVTRRSLHLWASGKPMLPANQAHVRELLTAVRRIDRGLNARNRKDLFARQAGGRTAFDLLSDGRYEEAVDLIGEGGMSHPVARREYSEAMRRERRPPPPAELLGSLEDSVHVERGKLLHSKPIRRKGE